MPVQSSVTHFGVTFNFSAPRMVGQYCNGDWWVVGPVTITSMLPTGYVASGNFQEEGTYSGRVMHGAQLNPGNRLDNVAGTIEANSGLTGFQGYDGMTEAVLVGETIGNSPALYQSSLNVDPGTTGLPLFVTEGTVVKAISDPTPPPVGRPCITDLVALTVVTVQPAADAFRPAQALASKVSNWRESDLDYSFLPNLEPTASAPTFTAAADKVSRLRYLGKTLNVGALNVMPSNNHENYGLGQAHEKANALLRLCTAGTVDEKRGCMVGLVQIAIDTAGRVEEGGIFPDNGGNSSGWKAPILLAARALDDAGLLAVAQRAKTFAEDRQCFYISQADIDRVPYTADGRPRTPYTQDMLGLPEWGATAIVLPNRNGANLDVAYRQIAASSFRYHVLFAKLIPGMFAQWNDQATLDYCQRYYDFGPDFATSGGNAPAFPHEMLFTYWDGVPASAAELAGPDTNAVVVTTAGAITATPPLVPGGRLEAQTPISSPATGAPQVMAIPSDAKRFAYAMDPSDIVDFVFDARPSMDIDERISATWTLTMSAAGAAIGLRVRQDGAYAPTLVLEQGGLRFWLETEGAVQQAVMFEGAGVEIPLVIRWVTNNIIPRTIERTMAITVRQR